MDSACQVFAVGLITIIAVALFWGEPDIVDSVNDLIRSLIKDS